MSAYKIIKEGGKEYILASQAPDYTGEVLKTGFGIPSYRTLRYYVKEGIVERPLKRGKETYFETTYIVNIIQLLRQLQKWSISLNDIKRIVLNTRKHNQFEDAIDLLEAADSSYLIKAGRPGVLMRHLASDKPGAIKISAVEEEIKKLMKASVPKLKEIPW